MSGAQEGRACGGCRGSACVAASAPRHCHPPFPEGEANIARNSVLSFTRNRSSVSHPTSSACCADGARKRRVEEPRRGITRSSVHPQSTAAPERTRALRCADPQRQAPRPSPSPPLAARGTLRPFRAQTARSGLPPATSRLLRVAPGANPLQRAADLGASTRRVASRSAGSRRLTICAGTRTAARGAPSRAHKATRGRRVAVACVGRRSAVSLSAPRCVGSSTDAVYKCTRTAGLGGKEESHPAA